LQIILKIISKNPTHSDSYRIIGQILSDEGYPDKATEYLYNALRWNPQNNWALIMLGNVYAKHRNDINTATIFYNRALMVNPDDFITQNNIGANLMQLKRYEEAKVYFDKAYKINPDYPNTIFAFGLINEFEGNNELAFAWYIKSLKSNKSDAAFYEKTLDTVIKVALKLIKSENVSGSIRNYILNLEKACGKPIEEVVDNTIPTAAKLEIAENKNTNRHVIRYKSSYPAFQHLVMHELTHLDFNIQAQKTNNNYLFIANQANRKKFNESLEKFSKNLLKKGYKETVIDDYLRELFDGINRQIFNTPIDLFIEDKLYRDYPELRPFQFISLMNLSLEGIKAVTDKKAINLSPVNILSKSKIFNLVSVLFLKELFGVNFINRFKATTAEIKTAGKLFESFLEIRDRRIPGEEYFLAKSWGEELGLADYFELLEEGKYRKGHLENNTVNDYLFDDRIKRKETEQFIQSQKESGLNMAVVMYMVEALQFFQDKPNEEIKSIAFEIAMQGANGYRPEVKNYRLNLIPDKFFSGYQILAYYYISWLLAIPEMHSQLQLPFDEEYKMAKSLFK